MNINDLVEEVKAINDEKQISEIVSKYNLVEVDRNGVVDQTLGIYQGVIDGKTITLSHRWYDRCKTFSIQPDGNKVELKINDVKIAEGTFFDKM